MSTKRVASVLKKGFLFQKKNHGNDLTENDEFHLAIGLNPHRRDWMNPLFPGYLEASPCFFVDFLLLGFEIESE